ncbi:MAG TPA: hypothetical protein VKW78_14290 [Terriglobales bacterium]|nr:hypothetical protein [Terriglobales bacterium]
MADEKTAGRRTLLGTEEQRAEPSVKGRFASEMPHGIVDVADAGGNAPIDANSFGPNAQKPLRRQTDEGETRFSDVAGNGSAGPIGSIHNFAGGGNMKTSARK